MKTINRYILRQLPAPFFGWLSLLVFLLLMQFLIKYLKELVGKGLPYDIILELIVFNLAYMVVLAVPMAILVSSFSTFGRLSESNAYLAVKSAGVSLPQIIWPVVLAGCIVGGSMWYFNHEILPEANFRARNLWQDIRQKKPAFALEPGVFYDGLKGYSILVHGVDHETNSLEDVLVLDYSSGSRSQTAVKSQRGLIQPLPGGQYVELLLEQGELHRKIPPRAAAAERYETVSFDRLNIRLDMSDFSFERSDPTQGYRSDRTMRTSSMRLFVDSLDRSVATARQELARDALSLVMPDTSSRVGVVPTAAERQALPSPRDTGADATSLPDSARAQKTFLALQGAVGTVQRDVYLEALREARARRTRIDEARRTATWEDRHADQFRVEIHKKSSIAVACLIFVLLGVPLGLSVRRHGYGRGGALAVAIFLFYWVTLVQGEKLADRGLLAPWVGMWVANIVMLLVGAFMLYYVGAGLSARPRRRRSAVPPEPVLTT